jgi:hypothetical protein
MIKMKFDNFNQVKKKLIEIPFFTTENPLDY